MNHPPSPRVVWRIVDARPGHENQSAGLVAALRQRMPLAVHDLPAAPASRAAAWWLRRRYPPGRGLPDPDLVIGAGHATHLAALAARRARGGRAVVLMRPSLPLAWFDLCIIPAHDRPPARANVLVTRGVLNRMRPAVDKDPRQALVLIGGPSAHCPWDSAAVGGQIEQLLGRRPDLDWTLADSRRTPPGLLSALAAGLPATVRVAPWQESTPGWLAGQLATAATVWVSEDSVSMVFEALSAGAAVGLLELPMSPRSRVTRGIRGLAEEGLVTRYTDWYQGRALRAPAEPFDEAARCARWLHEQWLSDR